MAPRGVDGLLACVADEDKEADGAVEVSGTDINVVELAVPFSVPALTGVKAIFNAALISG